MTYPDFIALVKRMRKAQRDYFRTRDRAVLDLAQRLERAVDEALSEQGSLFDENNAVQ